MRPIYYKKYEIIKPIGLKKKLIIKVCNKVA